MRIGLLGDIHEDLRSLRKALRQLERRNCDELVCLGDIVGFDVTCDGHADSRRPSACIAAIRSDCAHVVVGNHDLYAIRKIPRSSHAFTFPSNWYELSVEERRGLCGNRYWLYESESTTTKLTRAERNYLDSLPEHLVLTWSGRRVHLSHSCHPDVTGSLMLRAHNPWEMRGHMQVLKSAGCAYGLSGHRHPDGVILARENDMREAPFGAVSLGDGLVQLSCPGIADGGSRPGYAIVDTNALTIETFALRDTKSRRETWYGRLLGKS